jgi:septum formation protein
VNAGIDATPLQAANSPLTTTNTMPAILLASNSPRRRELMTLGQWSFSVSIPNVDESRRAGEAPGNYVVRLAETKARAAASAAEPSSRFVVAADTAVVDGDALLGKPADAAEAMSMLRRLRGHTHQVYTGLSILDLQSSRLLTDLCVTDVPMRRYSEAEIIDYVGTADPLDKAGAYAIQHLSFRPVEGLRGCYASVMGMPLCHLSRLLARLGAQPPADLSATCQAHLDYDCPVSDAILRGEQVG